MHVLIFFSAAFVASLAMLLPNNTLKPPSSEHSYLPFFPARVEELHEELTRIELDKSATYSIVNESARNETEPKPVAYQSKFVPTKKKPEKAGSQEAPPDATFGLMTKHPAGKPMKKIFCYYGSSANSRKSIGKFWPEHIDPFVCTHLIFAFVDITKDGTGIKPNNWNDLGENGLYARTMKLKTKNPDLKILLAVGGWKIGSKPFLPMIANQETWREWCKNVITYLRKFNFDGLDMDWEFPGWRGSGPEDREKFTLFMKDLYESFAAEAAATGKERLLLTLATASSAFYAEKSYEQGKIHKYVDYILLMTYNYHGSGWEKETGHHSPLLPHPLDPEGEQRELYILWSIKYWLNFGVPKDKLIMGLATYGLGWKLTDPEQTGVRAPADGGTTKGKYSVESGILSHYEICEKVIENGWKVKWIDEQKVPYAYGEGEWVGFDSPDSFYLKAMTIIKEGLAGAFVWSVEMDDFTGHCGGPKYPLLRTIYEVFTQAPMLAEMKVQRSPVKSAAAAVGGHLHPPAVHTHGHSNTAAAHPAPVIHEDEPSHYESYDWEDESADYGDSHSSPSSHSSSSYDYHHGDYYGNDYDYAYYYTYDNSEGYLETIDCDHMGLGIHADPKSCHHFILCMPVTHSNLGATRMSCPHGTLYDDHLKVCNHQHNVHCDR